MTYYPHLGVEITGSPDHIILHAVMNPVTRSQPRLTPPIELNSAEAVESFDNWVLEHCRRAWMSEPRQDPAVIDASNWREDYPAGV